MSVFKRSAEQYLGITSDLTNTTIDATSIYVTGDLTVTGTITSGSTGATGSGDFEVTGDLIVDQYSYLKGPVEMEAGMGCTGNATFYGQIRGRSYVSGIFPYFFVSVNNASGVYTDVASGGGINESIIRAMYLDAYELSFNGLDLEGSGGTDSYIEPTNAGIYMMSFMAVLKNGDVAQRNAVIPYIYPRDNSPASWVITTNTPSEESFGGFAINGDANQACIQYNQMVYIPTGGDTRVDLRAIVISGTFNIAFGSFSLTYVSSL